MDELNQTPLYKKVMIIDDNEIDRYVGSRNLKKYGFAEEVILKESVDIAIEYLTSLAGTPDEKPQFIFLDIRMPEKDGFNFLEEFERLPESVKENCTIMMLSTSLDPADHERAKNNKYVSKFINKPLDHEKLMEVKDLLVSSGSIS